MEIYVLPRVHERHPELSVEDVLAAFRSVMVDARRDNGTWVCIGLDGRGRDAVVSALSANPWASSFSPSPRWTVPPLAVLAAPAWGCRSAPS